MNVTPHWASHLKRPAAWAEASDEDETWLVPDFHIAHLHGSRSRLPKKRLRGEVATVPTSAVEPVLAAHFPDFLPSVPDPSQPRLQLLHVSNPYAPDGVSQHAKRGLSQQTAVGLHVKESNGLLKFRRNNAISGGHAHLGHHVPAHFTQAQYGASNGGHTDLFALPRLPRDFGRGFKLSHHDAALLEFYVKAFCTGRTILPNSNSLLEDITSMIPANACVMHALFAVSATYILDYEPSESLERLADRHHREAVRLLGLELNKWENYLPGNESAVLAAIVLLNQDDVINWEFRDKKTVPKWYRGIQAAKRLLDQSDPGYRFKRPENVQSSKARRHLGGMVAEDAIFNAVIAKLDLSQTRCPFPWLLEGGERDVRRIAGLLGMSPKLLHTFAQITHLCGRYANESTSLVYPLAIKAIERQLENFWQWSELCNGFGTSEALFESCELDSDGKVDDSGKVTLLGAEAHAASARLYLQCRFYRKPRQHPEVEAALQVLLQCIRMSPNKGPLFTSQAPFFSVVMAGLIAHRPDDRAVVRDWFVPVVEGSRGNVPPAWSGVQHLWEWHDSRPPTSYDDRSQISFRLPWWEDMVDELRKCEGILALT